MQKNNITKCLWVLKLIARYLVFIILVFQLFCMFVSFIVKSVKKKK